MIEEELKIVIVGNVGAGKTSAIEAISEIPLVSTDVSATDDVKDMKLNTTVAMDYGELTLEDGKLLRIYGTPGQERFSFMWDILGEDALGIIILVSHNQPNSLEALNTYWNYFKDSIEQSTGVIGVTHIEDSPPEEIQQYYDFMEQRNIHYPLFSIDARREDHMKLILKSMAAMV